MDRLRSSFYRMAAIWVGLSLVTIAASGSPEKKKLTIENIMELLSGGVSVHRVTHLVQERGIDFQLTPRLEQAFQDAGADQDLLLALRAPTNVAAALRPPEGSAGTPAKQGAPSSRTLSNATPSPGPPSATAGPMQLAGLQIRSRPGDVSIFVDDQPKGKTDPEEGRLEISALKPGKHRLRATHEGYQELEGTVEVAAGQILETPLWLAKSEATAPAVPSAPSLPAGKKFLVRHKHAAIGGVSSEGYCQGWMIVNVGYVRYISTDSPHTYLMNTSEMREAKPGSGFGSFLIKLDFGRKYEFAAVDEKGKDVSPGPVLTEIRYSMGQ